MSAKVEPHTGVQVMSGNEACALGAMAAGLSFFAGYPITPSSEIAEELVTLLPKHGGAFIQMEDEIAAMGAVIGAALAGAKAMTATSGPGFSLKQENIGFACMAEVPCVVVNVQRGGPSTGLPTMPAQGDVMQARWGTHGDHPTIALVPNSVAETFDLTVRAFNLSEAFRTPVILLLDEIIGHVNEKVTLPARVEVVNRTGPDAPPDSYLPYRHTESGVPPMATYGRDGYRFHVTGLAHNQTGFPTNDPMLPATGSTMMQAICSPSRDAISFTAPRSLYATVSVYFARSAGTPGLSGRPKVATPLPAFTSRLSP